MENYVRPVYRFRRDMVEHRLLDAGRALISEPDPEAVLERLLEAARDITGARHAIIDVARPPTAPFLGVPIMVDGEAWANVYLTEKAGGGAFTAGDVEARIPGRSRAPAASV